MPRALLAVCFFACSCVAPQQEPQQPSLHSAFDALVIGKSTKADVRAALGEATVIDFASGYEVWVYREALKDQPPREFVLLFDPSGTLGKKREKQGRTPISRAAGVEKFRTGSPDAEKLQREAVGRDLRQPPRRADAWLHINNETGARKPAARRRRPSRSRPRGGRGVVRFCHSHGRAVLLAAPSVSRALNGPVGERG